MLPLAAFDLETLAMALENHFLDYAAFFWVNPATGRIEFWSEGVSDEAESELARLREPTRESSRWPTPAQDHHWLSIGCQTLVVRHWRLRWAGRPPCGYGLDLKTQMMR